MPDESVFEKTYQLYLDQVFNKLPHLSIEKLGISASKSKIDVDLLNRSFTVSRDGVFDSTGERPSFDICVILLKYLLTERDNYPQDEKWCSYRDLKDSNPLINYFKTSVENAFIKEFSGNPDRLRKSCESAGGIYLQGSFNQDIAMQFKVLPRVPVLLLFNDEDEEFPAACSVLFERRAENYLDAECLAMVGRFLFESLVNTSKS